MESFKLLKKLLRYVKKGSVLQFNFEGTARICNLKGNCSERFSTGAATDEKRMEIARKIAKEAGLSGKIELCGNPKDLSARIRFV